MPKKSSKKSKPPTKMPINSEELAWVESPFEAQKTEKCCIGIHTEDPTKKLYPNYYFVKKDSIKRVKYFLLDEKDRQLFEGANEQNMGFLKSLTDFMEKFNPQKRIYLRMFHNRNTSYCLSDDLLEIIPLVLKQQDTPIATNDERLQKLRQKWAPQHEDIVNTVVEKAEVNEVMRMFKLDLKSIEMIPDLEYDARFKLQTQNMTEFVCYINRDGKEVVFSEQAIYHLYRECMCGINWNIKSCKTHPQCRDDCKKLIKNFAFVYKTLEPNSQISLNSVKEHIDFVQTHCFFNSQASRRKVDYLLKNHKYSDIVPAEVLQEIYKKFGFVRQVEKQKILEQLTIFARAAIFGRWLSSFFNADEESEKYLLIDIFCSMMDFGRAENEVKEGILKKCAFTPNLVSTDTELVEIDDDDDKNNYFDFSPLQEWRRKPEEEQNRRKANEEEDDGWNDYSIKTEGAHFLSGNIFTINEKTYISNHEIIKLTNSEKEENTRFFFLNVTKHARFGHDGVENTSYPSINLNTYSPSSDEFVVRSFQTRTGCYILTSEILELIPVLMEKQGVPVEKYEKKLKSYAENWKPEMDGVHNSVEVSFFKIIMNSFNVNRSFITIFPDPFHHRVLDAVLEAEIIYTSFEDDTKIMCKEQGMLLIFQEVICGVNWKTKKCCLEKNQRVLDDFKTRYTNMIILYTQRLRKGAFVSYGYAKACAVSLLKHPIFTEKIVQRYSDFHYDKPNYDSFVSMEEHIKKCERFGIPKNDQLFQPHEPPSAPMCILKAYNYVEVMEIFYPEYVFEEKNMLLEEIVLFLPKEIRAKALEYFRCIVRRTINICLSEGRKKNEKHMEVLYKKERDVQERKRQIKKAQEAEKKSLKKAKPPVVEEVSDDNDPPPAAPEKPKKAKKVPKEPRPCNKCTENGVALLNARDDLKKIEIIARSNEKRAKRTEKADQDLEDRKLEMEEMKKEIDDLRIDLKDFDRQEELKKVENTNILKDIENLEHQIKVEKEKTAKDRKINSRLIGKFNETQENLAMKESNREAQGRRPTVSSEGPSTYHVPFVPSLPTTDDPELARNPEWVLEQWEKMKSDFEKDDVVQDEKDMIENLLAICEEDLHVKHLAEYELFQFEASARMYLQNIELNILKIQKTGDTSNMRPLAKYPSLSAEFWVEYEKYMGC